MKFVDEVKITVEAGDGGNGCVSFRKEKFVPRGGPDGGDGGSGGSVYLIGSKSFQTLYDLQLRPHYRAGRGQHGKGKGMAGRTGENIYVKVPVGVVVIEKDKILGEIMQDKEQMLIARGGKGGWGNRHFATPTNRAPRYAEQGEIGEKRELKIVLKLISDVGIVGFPNAGKSTLLKTLTNAQPQIGDYPFTTLSPNLGVLKGSLKSIVIADMPGIIEGAHKGKGLGLKFLRHIERTEKLILLVDLSVANPLSQYNSLLEEFKKYNKHLLLKPRLVVFNKIDLFADVPRFNLKEKTIYISALKHKGLKALTEYLMNKQ